MKKNVFSRTLAVLASTVVLGAASMMSANAAGETLTLASVEGKAGETVMVDVVVGCRNNFESLDMVVSYDTALTAAAATPAGGTAGASNVFGDGTLSVVAYGSAPVADGTVAQIPFTIPADAVAGTVYNVEIATVNMFAECDNPDDYTETVAKVNGTITVAAEPTDPTVPDTTAAETTAAATTTTAAPATGAPKTGNAGVAVAVAGLVAAGATAVVLKKRH